MKVWYFPIESYTERYTAQLVNWTTKAFERNGIEWFGIQGSDLSTDGQIANHGPLDFTKRPYFSTSQVATFMTHAHKVRPGDVIYFDDMFTPGFEAIPYYLDLMGLKKSVRIYARNHAGTADIYDYVWPSRRWMTHYEKMVAAACEKIFCGSTIHQELMTAQGIENVEVVGLPFDRDEVLSYTNIVQPKDRKYRVLFSSRWDIEKDPLFFIGLAKEMKLHEATSHVELAVATGKKTLTSNVPGLVDVARDAQSKGLITIYEGLSKVQYYELLASSRVQFNCALQDFVSYTMLEASAYEVPTVAPCFRSFPEALKGDRDCLYIPSNIEDAFYKVHKMLEGEPKDSVIWPSIHHHQTLDKICREFKLN